MARQRRTSKSPAAAARGGVSAAKDQPKEVHYEFGGPIGAASISVMLPLTIYLLFFLCPSRSGEKGADITCFDPFDTANINKSLSTLGSRFEALPGIVSDSISKSNAPMIFLLWMAFQAIMERYLPCETADGVLLSNGNKLSYRLNGHLIFWVSIFAVEHLDYLDKSKVVSSMGDYPLAFIYDQYLQLATASIVFSFALSFYLYFSSFQKDADGEEKLLAPGGDTKNVLYDWFIGRELNPRVGAGATAFDLKCFCELRPGLIGWVVVNIGMMQKYQQEHEGNCSPELILLNLFQGLYVWDALYNERAILTTMDITTDGFGFMLAFGDLAWVPFTYTLQARYLVDHSPNLSTLELGAICVLKIVGYIVFRGANGEKDAFRRDPTAPEVAHLETITTKYRGRKLLVSGWWGLARKINYTGDWLMGLAWCSLCGRASLVPYFYSIYFAILLVHRAERDNEACGHKYGADWAKYKAKVKYVFIPGVY